MTYSFSICGWVRVRKCKEVEVIVTRLAESCSLEIELDVFDVEEDQLQISVEASSVVPSGAPVEIEELLRSLGPYASEGAVFSGECDGQPWEMVVAPSEEAGRVALSQSRFEEIDPLVDDLTVGDREKLIAKLQATSI
jgi:hypothetical protein